MFDTVVIGAGLAGLVAARGLIAKGQRVCVLEARSRAGGRTFADIWPGTDRMVDWGAEWVIPALHPQILALAKETGVSLSPFSDDDTAIWHTSTQSMRASFQDIKSMRPGFSAALHRIEADAAIWQKQKHGKPEHPFAGRSLAEYCTALTADQLDRDLLLTAIFPLTGADPAHVSPVMLWNEVNFHDDSIDGTLDAETCRFEEEIGRASCRERV